MNIIVRAFKKTAGAGLTRRVLRSRNICLGLGPANIHREVCTTANWTLQFPYIQSGKYAQTMCTYRRDSLGRTLSATKLPIFS